MKNVSQLLLNMGDAIEPEIISLKKRREKLFSMEYLLK
jgi:hypothetical protein